MGSIPTTGANLRPYNHQIGLDTQHATPPVDAYVTVDDLLWIMVSAETPQTTVTVVARILLPDGTIVLNNWPQVPASTRAATYFQQRLPEGFILSISATANLAPTAAPAFVALYISRSQPGSFQAAQLLCQGYTYNNQPVSWPGGININSADNAGTMRLFIGTTPAPAAEISETVPANARWRVVAFRYTLTTSALVATRSSQLLFDDGTNIFANSATPTVQAASLTWVYSYAVGYAGVTRTDTPLMIQLPTPMVLNPSSRIRTTTPFLSVGDQYSAPIYLVEEWVQP